MAEGGEGGGGGGGGGAEEAKPNQEVTGALEWRCLAPRRQNAERLASCSAEAVRAINIRALGSGDSDLEGERDLRFWHTNCIS